jgi:hypothetical protein
MKTINIKGKEYVPVVERVKEFHKVYPMGRITTEILPISDTTRVIIKATVDINKEIQGAGGKIIGHQTFTGHSQAEWGKGMMGGVALEVAETSAIGRALGFANIGLLDGIASADEIRKVKQPSKVADDDDGDVPF